jgi:hypothetical protein
VVEEGGYPPSAYDLIVMCNFLTNTSFTARFESEIAGLPRSLTPGGVLLVLGWDRRAIPGDLRGSRQGGRLSTPSTCRQRGSPRPVRAEGTANCCGPDHLLPSKPQKRAPQAYSTVQDGLPKNVHLLDPERLHFPHFHVCAYKREGQATFSARENRRMVRPRTRPRAPGSRY